MPRYDIGYSYNICMDQLKEIKKIKIVLTNEIIELLRFEIYFLKYIKLSTNENENNIK